MDAFFRSACLSQQVTALLGQTKPALFSRFGAGPPLFSLVYAGTRRSAKLLTSAFSVLRPRSPAGWVATFLEALFAGRSAALNARSQAETLFYGSGWGGGVGGGGVVQDRGLFEGSPGNRKGALNVFLPLESPSV